MDVEHIISDPWWALDQSTVDLMKASLATLLTSPRSPHPDAPPLPLSPREVEKWRRLMRAVDRGYVKQLRRRRLKAKQEAGVRGEEVDLLERSGSAGDLSISVDYGPLSPTLSVSAGSPLSPSLPSHCYLVPPVPPFIPVPSPSTLSFWQQQVIPRFSAMQYHPLTLRQWSKEGIPAACRWEVWTRKLPRDPSTPEDTFARYWRGERGGEGEEEKTDAPDLSQPSTQRSSSTSSRSTPSSPSSPSTPLPDTVHAFSLPAVALTAAESSIQHTLEDSSANSSISNDLVRMFDGEHLEDLELLDGVRAAMGLPPLFSSLHSLLATFAAYEPDTSYVQGMSYMACLLLLYLPVVDAFTALCSLLRHDWYSSYAHMNVTAMQSRCSMFALTLSQNRPRLAVHLTSLPPDTYFIEWMVTFYIPLLSFAFTSALFDLYLLKGEEVIHRVGVALLTLGEEELLSCSVMECSQWLRGGMKDEGVDEEEVWRLMMAVDIPPIAKAFFQSKAHT